MTVLLVLMLGSIFTTHSVFAADDKMDPRVEASINQRIMPIGQVRMDKAEVSSSMDSTASASKIDANAAYQSACFACHGIGAAGAPYWVKKMSGSRVLSKASQLYTAMPLMVLKQCLPRVVATWMKPRLKPSWIIWCRRVNNSQV